MSSCEDMADINELDDRDGEPEDDSCEAALILLNSGITLANSI